jgi:hypothetical protein
MSTKQKSNIIAYDIGISGVGDHNSISSGRDDGANRNLACGFWKSVRHATTKQSVDNFLKKLGASVVPEDIDAATGSGALNLGGHGNEGFLTVGCGQHDPQDYKTNYMASWNRPYWEPHFKRLAGKNFPWLRIWSCHSGAGQSGADFLFEIAKVIGKPVMGNTGFLYSNSKCKIWMENGAVWQVATPTNKPKPIDSPTPHLTVAPQPMQNIFQIGEAEIPLDKIESISLEFFSHENPPRTEALTDKEVAGSILEELITSPQFDLPGAPAAFKTCKLSLKSSKGEITLDVFNDRLIVDVKSETAIYVGSHLSSLISGLRGTK